MNTIILANKINFQLLADTLAISSNYCYKIIRKINTFLKNHDLWIGIKKGTVFLSGLESKLRFFAYQFILNSYSDLEWPFKSIDEKELLYLIHTIDASEYMASASINSLKTWLGILYLRLVNGYYV